MTTPQAADTAALDRVLRRGTAQVIPHDQLATALATPTRPLRVKYGIDPSSTDLHLGHTVCFRKLRHFQELGHTIVIIIGDWTAQIGDPSGRSATRKMLTADEVRANAKTYTDQLFRILSPTNVEVRWQSDWFGPFTLADVVQLTSRYTVAQLLARDDFRKRFEANQPLAVVELLYPLLQGYDSVAVQSDVELGGTDQTFNLLVGRDMQEAFGQAPQAILTVPILVGTDGEQKMSKSLGNAIPVATDPDDQFGKIMSLPDSAILSYFELVTDVSAEDLVLIRDELRSGQVNPRDIKRRLGREVVAQFHGAAAASAADEEFLRRFSRRELPEDMPAVALAASWFDRPVKLADLVAEVGLAPSKSEARRLAQGGAIRLNGEKVGDVGVDTVTVAPGDILQVARRKFVRLVVAA